MRRNVYCALALGALASALAVGCGGEPSRSAVEDGQPNGKAAAAKACPLDWPGGFAARPYAKWVRAFVERAGYRIVDQTPSAFVAAGKGHEFYVWAVQDTPSDPHLAAPDDFEIVARVGDVAVYGHAGMVDWWPSQGFHIWIQHGPRVKSVAPGPEEIASLVEASVTLQAPSPC